MQYYSKYVKQFKRNILLAPFKRERLRDTPLTKLK